MTNTVAIDSRTPQLQTYSPYRSTLTRAGMHTVTDEGKTSTKKQQLLISGWEDQIYQVRLQPADIYLKPESWDRLSDSPSPSKLHSLLFVPGLPAQQHKFISPLFIITLKRRVLEPAELAEESEVRTQVICFIVCDGCSTGAGFGLAQPGCSSLSGCILNGSLFTTWCTALIRLPFGMHSLVFVEARFLESPLRNLFTTI